MANCWSLSLGMMVEAQRHYIPVEIAGASGVTGAWLAAASGGGKQTSLGLNPFPFRAPLDLNVPSVRGCQANPAAA